MKQIFNMYLCHEMTTLMTFFGLIDFQQESVVYSEVRKILLNYYLVKENENWL